MCKVFSHPLYYRFKMTASSNPSYNPDTSRVVVSPKVSQRLFCQLAEGVSVVEARVQSHAMVVIEET
jgi:hypothetical protein